jgi:hypothetical protein
MFHRDEIDVLEEEFDALFDHRNHADDPAAHEAEEWVLEEQVSTEEQSEADLTLRLGPVSEPTGESWPAAPEAAAPSVPLKDALRQSAVRDPFYERVFEWAGRLSVWARARYDAGGRRRSDFFRVLVNAYLVPVKLASALGYEVLEEAASAHVAAKEAELAFVYLTRIAESLSALSASGVLAPEEGQLLQEAEEIRQGLETVRGRLSSRSPWTPPPTTL